MKPVVLEQGHTRLPQYEVSDPKDETVIGVISYNFFVLNSSVTSHLWKIIISPTLWNQFYWNLWFWNVYKRGYVNAKLQTHMSSNFGDTAETISGISIGEIGKVGLPILGASLHCFQKRSTFDNSPWRGPSFYPIRSLRFQVLKIRVSLTNPRSARSGTRTDTSNR